MRKLPGEIRSRLIKLKSRYTRKYVSSLLDKKPCNCVFNYEHTPTGKKSQELPTELSRSPRIFTSLVVIQPDAPVRICTYGSGTGEWNGDICDRDETAKNCSLYASKTSEADALRDFDARLQDDAYVYEHYKDIAALQWVLNERVYTVRRSVWDRLILGFDSFIRWFTDRKTMMHAPRKPEILETPDPVLEALWDDADSKDSGK